MVLSVCMLLCIGVQVVLFVWSWQRLHFCCSFCRSQCSVLSVFPLLQKEGTQMGKLCTWMQMKQLSTSLDDVAGELPEDIWLMRGLCRSERQSRSLTCFETVYSRVIINTFVQGWVL